MPYLCGINYIDIHESGAVRDGNVGAVPVHTAVCLFGFGLLGLVGIARRKKA